MKHRSNTTTIILVVALLSGLAFVGASVGTPPKLPEKQVKAAEEEAKKGPSAEAMASEKKQREEMMIQMNKAKNANMMKSYKDGKMKFHGDGKAAAPGDLDPADNPQAMAITNDIYRNGKDGAQGTAEMTQRMDKKLAEIIKQREIAKKTAPPKEAPKAPTID
jgi:hypothetical protein